MSRLLALAACCALLASPSALASKIGDGGAVRRGSPTVPGPSWAQADIRYVVSHGLMAKTVASFRASDPLTQGELAALVAGLTKQAARAAPVPSAPVAAAPEFTAGARGAGLTVPSRFGTESVVRLLGLRTNHPAKQDDLELLPNDP